MQRVCSIFSQILGLIPRAMFDQAVRQHEAEKHAKGLTSWSQFIALMFCQLGGARSLREIIGGLQASEGKLRHLGVSLAPTRSTLAYANQHRPWQVYKTLFEELVVLCHGEAALRKRKFRFKQPLLSLDATVIPLCLSMYDWALYRKKKGAAKVHVVMDNATLLPQYAVITEGRVADITAARGMTFPPGALLVFDRGYEDHRWWRNLNAGDVRFVSRLKDSTNYTIVEQRAVLPHTGILRDEVIVLASEKEADQPLRLRRVEIWLEEKQDTLAFITNDLKLAASTIAAIYKDRWQIELFFKALKQSLRIKAFIGTSENAVQTQIWTALIAMLLVRFLQLRSTWNWGLSNLVALLRQQLFVYRDMLAWLNQPFQPPIALDELQLPLPGAGLI
jgi:diacylglycerol kinase